MQTISSANTSINKRLPKLYGQLPKDVRNCQMLDYGCGKYPEYARKWAEERGIAVTSYDKYNYPSNDWFKPYGYDVVTCSNVLNVIKDYDARRDLLIDCYECLRISGKLYLTVYEGDRTGKGKVTKSDCWQENRKLSDYLDEVRRVFGQNNATIKNGMIIARRSSKMTDNKGRKIKAVYTIGYDAAYCIYNLDSCGGFVETAYTWCGKWTRKTKNKLEYDSEGHAYFRKFKHILYLTDFMLTD